MTFKVLAISFIALGFVICVGCGKTSAASNANSATTPETHQSSNISEIETVRNGVLVNENTTTVGKAFEGTFQNSKWTTFDTPKGKTVVQFNGTVQSGLLEKMTGGELTSAYAMYTNNTNRLACITSLGLAATFDELKQQADASKAAYYEKLDPIFRRIDGQYYHDYVARSHNPFGTSSRPDDPFREIDAARRDELNSEKQALSDVNQRVADCMNSTSVPVKFQFVLTADKKSFTLDYVDDAFNNDSDRALAFIYK